MNYKTYAEAKIANPDCEIVTTGKDWAYNKNSIGLFQAIDKSFAGENFNPTSWVICNPADHCSTLKEFLDAGLKLVEGDAYVEISGGCKVVNYRTAPNVNYPCTNDCDRYILLSVALNGGCKIELIEHKAEPWTVYNNTLPLSELSDEQAAQLFNAWRAGGEVECTNTTTKDLRSGLTTFEWSIPSILNWDDYLAYRIKPKSERELFIENTTKVMRDAGTKCPDNHEYFGIMFDAGARYKDLTQHFGENI